MEKMIGGSILCIIGGLGFLYSLGGIVNIVTTVTGIPGMGLITNPVLGLNAILFIASIVFFGLGIILIQSDREVVYYERY